MLLAVIVFIAGLPMHRIHVVQGSSTVVEILQVYVAAFRNRKLQLPEDPLDFHEINKDKEAAIEAEFLPHRDTLRFLDKAAIQASTEKFPEAPNPWKLRRVTQVENAKNLLSIFPVFSCTIIMTLCLAQLQTFSIQQGLTMDTSITKSFNIPPASLPIIPVIFLIILVPIYDRLAVPFARKFTGLPTGIIHLQRIGVGLILSSICMASAALMEVKRRDVARDHNMLDAIPVLQPLPISTLWVSIHFFIFDIADMFTYVGLLEFFYSEAPKGLKSISTCFLWSSMALGYFLSTILVNIVNGVTKGSTKSGGCSVQGSAKVATRGFSYEDSLVGASYLNQRMAEDCPRDDYSSEDDDEDFGDEDCPGLWMVADHYLTLRQWHPVLIQLKTCFQMWPVWHKEICPPVQHLTENGKEKQQAEGTTGVEMMQ
ncbi:hypothetical protein NC653_010775 [Populus alba x Populus x berolinensis]|uniref:Uncharacterized protein n=1 Tax=Populus alba x Populus x berolinensis TaxID=444605 RepID=A0AAD6R0X1_9ROSI|nr:hypothetical protein NC653_010775 [Populus alba x Populus x berolinensis]